MQIGPVWARDFRGISLGHVWHPTWVGAIVALVCVCHHGTGSGGCVCTIMSRIRRVLPPFGSGTLLAHTLQHDVPEVCMQATGEELNESYGPPTHHTSHECK